jgi:hypothetical protein
MSEFARVDDSGATPIVSNQIPFRALELILSGGRVTPTAQTALTLFQGSVIRWRNITPI